MRGTLQSCVQKLSGCRSVNDVNGAALDTIRRVFGAHTAAVLFLDDSMRTMDRACFGVRQTDVEEYETLWRPHDLVFSAVMARAAPVHNWQVYREGEWERSVAYVQYGRRLDIYQYMSSPIFGSSGNLVGVLNFCRRPHERPLNAASVETAGTLSGFLSATLSRVCSRPGDGEPTAAEGLSARELQVARLAASGRNNLQIALQLGLARETVKQTLRRVYRKLDASGRAPMAARLSVYGLL